MALLAVCPLVRAVLLAAMVARWRCVRVNLLRRLLPLVARSALVRAVLHLAALCPSVVARALAHRLGLSSSPVATAVAPLLAVLLRACLPATVAQPLAARFSLAVAQACRALVARSLCPAVLAARRPVVVCPWRLPTAGLVGRVAPFRSPRAVLLAVPVVTSLCPLGRRPAALAAQSPCLLARVAAVAAALCRFLPVPRLLALAAPRRLRLGLAVLVAAMCALQVAWVRVALAVRFGWRAARAPLASAALCRCRLRLLARLARAAA